MVDAFLLLMASVSAVFGMAWFALAKESHWMQVRGSEPLTMPMKQTLRGFGTTCIVASLVLCLFADHPTMAVLVWIMLIAASALVVAFTLAWRAQWLTFLIAWEQHEESQGNSRPTRL
jgi:hypothetical protein